MKEQDAAHSFDKTLEDYNKKSIVNFLCGSSAYDGYWWGDKPNDKRPPFWWRSKLREEFESKEAELTRLRSELQDTKDYYEDKLDARQRIIDQQFSELQQKREKVINECIEVVNNHHKGLKPSQNDSDDGYSCGVANCINLLYSMNEKKQS